MSPLLLPKIRRWDHSVTFDSRRRITATCMALRPQGRYVLAEDCEALLAGTLPPPDSIDWRTLALRAHTLLVRVADTGLDDSCLDDVAAWLENGPPAAALQTKDQYYYKDNACPAASPSASDCRCWHDEGTGPLPDGSASEWRTVPVAPEEVPVAWMYEHDGMVHDADHPPIVTAVRWPSVSEPWNETPLFAGRRSPA